MNLQPIFNIAEICVRHGVENVVLSPGSRCAPLTIAFVRHPQAKVKTVSDERAAAFIGLGMAQITRKPTVLICTSGTAALNYAPAVAEAFYQQVPLVVLTADRPAEWIDQLDGQTIRQENIYGRHIKQSYSFPADAQHPDQIWYGERILSEALLLAQAYPPGPVHINIPLREPFYLQENETVPFQPQVKIIEELPNAYDLAPALSQQLKQEITSYKKILVVAGQQPDQTELQAALTAFAAATGAVVVADVISNLHKITSVIRHHDVFLNGKNTSEGPNLQPDLVITFGLSNISKNLKLFMRAFPPLAHWHLQPAGMVADPFQSLTRIIRAHPIHFFNIFSAPGAFNGDKFRQSWQRQDTKAGEYLQKFLTQDHYNEFIFFRQILTNLPASCLLHVANSMAVRYANLISLQPSQLVEVFANRGTSGIDGCTSTAVGTALTTNQTVVLITGDLAFFYDRNGLWHNYLPQNLRIVLFNNHGGGIFRLIDGPKQQPELEEYFETRQLLNAEQTAKDFKLTYFSCRTSKEIAANLLKFWTSGPAILEIFTQSSVNAAFFDLFKKKSPFKAN